MKKEVKYVAIFLGAVAGILAIRYVIKKMNTPDVLTLQLSNVNNLSQSFDYVVLKNDKPFKSGSFNTRMSSDAIIVGKNKIQFDNYLETTIITGTSLDTRQFKTKITFLRSKDPKVPTATLEATIKNF